MPTLGIHFTRAHPSPWEPSNGPERPINNQPTSVVAALGTLALSLSVFQYQRQPQQHKTHANSVRGCNNYRENGIPGTSQFTVGNTTHL